MALSLLLSLGGPAAAAPALEGESVDGGAAPAAPRRAPLASVPAAAPARADGGRGAEAGIAVDAGRPRLADAPAVDAGTSASPVAAKSVAPVPVPVVPDAGSGDEASRSMTLVSGAPLSNPNVAVHTVERKIFADVGKRELAIYPAAVQINGTFTRHMGTSGAFVWHLQENLGLLLTGGYNWHNEESAFNRELVEKTSLSAEAAPSLLQTWSVLGGVEATPIYGKFAWFDDTLAHFGVFVTGGAGLGGTRHLLKAETRRVNGSVSPATYGDTGDRFLGLVGVGLRLQLGSRFTVRAEVRDVVYTARVERVNGCSFADLQVLDALNLAGRNPSEARGTVASRCDVGSFDARVDAKTGVKGSDNIKFATDLVKVPSSDVLNNVGLYVGASFLF